MLRFKNFWSFSVGSVAALVTVAICEAIYKNTDLLFSSLFYGCFAALVSILFWPIVWVLQNKVQIAWSRSSFLGLFFLYFFTLLQFSLFRDFFHEDPHKKLISLLFSAVVAVFLTAAFAIIFHFLLPRIRNTHFEKAYLLTVNQMPWIAVLGFFLLQRPDVEQLTAAPPRHNNPKGHGVIFIVADTLRADALGVYQASLHREQPRSKAIDALASQGQVFINASAQSSWTRPSMASIFTSQYPTGHRTIHKDSILPAELPHLAEELQKQGVKTAAVVTNFNLDTTYGFNRGFDEFYYLPAQRYFSAPPSATQLALYNAYRLIRERYFASFRRPEYFYQPGSAVNKKAFEIVDNLLDSRFFLWLHYMEPHDPYFAREGTTFARVELSQPPLDLANKMRMAYRDNVVRLDQAIDKLWQGLIARGFSEDQIHIVFTSDHGEEFAEHGGFYHGRTLYEEQLHVPLFIRGPDIRPGKNQTLARHIDLAPTIVGLFNLSTNRFWMGRDLLRKGNEAANYLTIAEVDHEGQTLTAIRVKTHKLIVSNPNNPRGLKPREFYDLDVDPQEQRPHSEPLTGEIDLEKTLRLVLKNAEQREVTIKQMPLDENQKNELRALGYVQ